MSLLSYQTHALNKLKSPKPHIGVSKTLLTVRGIAQHWSHYNIKNKRHSQRTDLLNKDIENPKKYNVVKGGKKQSIFVRIVQTG